MAPKFSDAQKELLDIVFGRVVPQNVDESERLPREKVEESSLDLMHRLAKLEFYSSLQNEIESTDDGVKTIDPKPYDVFQVERTFSNQNISIAVCIPVKNVDEVDLMWYDEYDNIWEIDALSAIRKVSSLSGTARVLNNLKNGSSDLMQHAMDRTGIFDVSLIERAKHDSKILNKSQNLAVLAVKSTSTFQRGFFVCQGPPGTGEL